MTNRRRVCAIVVPWALFGISAFAGGWCCLLYLDLGIHLAFAGDQTDIFAEMSRRSRASTDAAEIAGCLQYTDQYYRSGTKQRAGSTYDRIVEGYRAAAIREIIGRLRSVTGEDLGDDPQPWIEKFAGP